MGDTYKHDYMTQEQSIDHTNVTEGDIALAKIVGNAVAEYFEKK